jgi:hypothetical protein
MVSTNQEASSLASEISSIEPYKNFVYLRVNPKVTVKMTDTGKYS